MLWRTGLGPRTAAWLSLQACYSPANESVAVARRPSTQTRAGLQVQHAKNTTTSYWQTRTGQLVEASWTDGESEGNSGTKVLRCPITVAENDALRAEFGRPNSVCLTLLVGSL
jgi:hypothetical protein